MTAERVTIGTFSMLTGLSVTALRHDADRGILEPAEVDPRTGHRRYDRLEDPVGNRVVLWQG